MKKDIDKILSKLTPALETVGRHRMVIFIVFFLGIYIFLVYRINGLINSDPDPGALSQQLQTVQRLRIDQTSIDRIIELEEQNIEVKTLFEQARNNPFNE
jgi:hypothetical protein